jgi:hypothetical protein
MEALHRLQVQDMYLLSQEHDDAAVAHAHAVDQRLKVDVTDLTPLLGVPHRQLSP